MAFDHPLRTWRKSRKEPQQRTLAAIAKDAGVVPSHISQIETGQREPSLALASKLSSLTGIAIDKFVRPREAAQ